LREGGRVTINRKTSGPPYTEAERERRKETYQKKEKKRENDGDAHGKEVRSTEKESS